jgi:hypothetical protein
VIAPYSVEITNLDNELFDSDFQIQEIEDETEQPCASANSAQGAFDLPKVIIEKSHEFGKIRNSLVPTLPTYDGCVRPVDTRDTEWKVIKPRPIRSINNKRCPETPSMDTQNEDIDLFPVKVKSNNKRHNVKETKRRDYCVRQAKKKPANPEAEKTDLGDLFQYMADFKASSPLVKETTDDTWISIAEDAIFLIHNLYSAQSPTAVGMAFMQYAKTFCSGSLLVNFMEIVDSTSVSREKTNQARPESFAEDWKSIRTNDMWRDMSKIAAAVFSMRACHEYGKIWSVEGFNMMYSEVVKAGYGFDLVDTIIRVLAWVWEIGWEIVSTRSLRPLLFNNIALARLESEYISIMSLAPKVVTGDVPDEEAYELRVHACVSNLDRLKKQSAGPPKLWIDQRLLAMASILTDIFNRKKSSELRLLPVGLHISGETSRGKSTLAKILMRYVLSAMNTVMPKERQRPWDPIKVITLNLDDKHQNTMRNDVTGIHCDDVGQMKAEHAVQAFTNVLIQMFNNVPAQVIKAELMAKGMVFWNFWCGIITSNLEDFDAGAYSNAPEAVLRRFIHIRCEVKKEFQGLGGILNTDHPRILASDDPCLDVWTLTVQKCVPKKDRAGDTHPSFETIVHNDLLLENVGFNPVCKAVIDLAKIHTRKQLTLLEKDTRLSKTATCRHCCMFPTMCDCEEFEPVRMADHVERALEMERARDAANAANPEALEDQIFDVVVGGVKKGIWNSISGFLNPLDRLNNLLGFMPMKALATRKLADVITEEINSVAVPVFISIIPSFIYDSRIAKRATDTLLYSSANYDMRYHMKGYMYSSMLYKAFISYGYFASTSWFVKCSNFFGSRIALPSLLPDAAPYWVYMAALLAVDGVVLTVFWEWHKERIKQIKEMYLARRDALPDYAKTIRDSPTGTRVGVALVIAAFVAGIKLINRRRVAEITEATPESDGLTPEKMKKKNGWLDSIPFFPRFTPPTVANGSDTLSAVEKLVETNLAFVTLKFEGTKDRSSNAFFVRSRTVILPRHIFYEKVVTGGGHMYQEGSIIVRFKHAPGMKFECQLRVCDGAYIKSAPDLIMFILPKGPDLRDLTRLFPLTVVKGVNIPVKHIYKLRDLDTRAVDVNAIVGKFTVAGAPEFIGLTCPDHKTNYGQCTSVYVSTTHPFCIVGLHIGSYDDDAKDSGTGAYMLTVDDLQQAEFPPSRLTLKPAISNGIPKTQFGVELISKNEAHPESYFAKMDEDEEITFLGSTRVRPSETSRVQKSMLSDDVAKICGMPNVWQRPNMKPPWKQYNKAFALIGSPTKEFPVSALERAAADYFDPLIEIAKTTNAKTPIAPLSLQEALMGLPGERFMEGVNIKTGIGRPLSGPKENYLDIERGSQNEIISIKMVPELQSEYDRLMECYKSNKRGYPIFGGCLKDEAVARGSDKVRVFTAGPFAYGLIMRKYFLPIVRLLCTNPLVSESAVGINPLSSEWQDLMQHAFTHADTDSDGTWKKICYVFGWDYSKFDLRMSSQITTAVYCGFIDIARVCNYSDEDIAVMTTLVQDSIQPVIDANGNLFMAHNMNVSGGTLTVYVNNTGNALYDRLGFFHTYPCETSFRKCVKSIKYGDDNIGSVKKTHAQFNFTTQKAFLAQYDVKITKPDKSDEVTPFLRKEEADFLKRRSNYIPEIDRDLGALSIESIFKPFHMNVESKTASRESVAQSVFATAAHELFAHGREVFETRIGELKRVAQQNGVFAPALDMSFDERVQKWLKDQT